MRFINPSNLGVRPWFLGLINLIFPSVTIILVKILFCRFTEGNKSNVVNCVLNCFLQN